MRVLLVSLNARYVHTNLALRYLREAIKSEHNEVILKEFTINERVETIAAEIYETGAEVIGFSCYIWNIAQTLKVIRYLRPVCPDVRIVLGGPEVSFEAEELLAEHPEVDAIVVGEGEIPFPLLLRAWSQGVEPSDVPGLVWRRTSADIAFNPPANLGRQVLDLPMPYGTAEDLSGRIAYVETSRGCPFNCQYCLSSTFSGMRFLEPERFREMFRTLLNLGARTVKFVDRTFNARKEHAFQILEIVRQEAQAFDDVRVHCEMAGDLLDDDWMEYLAAYPPGLIQLEIGVQSTHMPTLQAICRVQSFEKWRDKVYRLQHEHGIPIHLDLIAGLPGESFQRFGRSFDDVYSALPNRLQLGFLKVLKGSGMRLKSAEYGFKYTPDPPYTILGTKDITHAELLQLARVEELLEAFYNSGKFHTSLSYILKHFSSPFAFYNQLANYWQRENWFKQAVHGKNLFAMLWQFVLVERPIGNDELARIGDALRFDYYLWERPAYLPDFLSPWPGDKDRENQFQLWQDTIRQDPIWLEVVAERTRMDRRQWSRATAVGYFTHQVVPERGVTVREVQLCQAPAEGQLPQEPTEVQLSQVPTEVQLFKAPSKVQMSQAPTEQFPGYWYLFYYRRPLEVFLIRWHSTEQERADL